MLQLRREPNFPQKAVTAQCRRNLRPHDLDRDLAVVLEIVRQIDSRHATAADLAIDRVAVGKGGLEVLKLVGHMTQKMGSATGGRQATYGWSDDFHNDLTTGLVFVHRSVRFPELLEREARSELELELTRLNEKDVLLKLRG